MSGTHPVRPGWTKKEVWEQENLIFFAGASTYRESEAKAKEEAISNVVKFLLGYAGLKDGEETLELFHKDLTPKIITALKRKEKGPYGVVMSDFYLEKYIVRKTKKPCYKGYIQLQFPLPQWLELRSYVRATIAPKYHK